MRNIKYYLFFLLFLPTTTLFGQDNVEILKKHVHILAADSLEGRGLGTAGKEKAVSYIVEQFKTIGLEPVTNDYKNDFHFTINGTVRVAATNIVGVIKGSDPELSEEFIVLGAHYDHLGYRTRKGKRIIYNGADDNASGVATIIEVARFLKENQAQLKRSVAIVAFDAEESGLVGSEYFLSDSIISPDQIKFMFSVDMVGMYSSIDGVRLLGMGLLKGGKVLAADIANKKGISVNKMNKRKVPNTDTGSFLKYQIPSVAVFTGMKSPYHKPQDTAEKLDYEGIGKVTDLLGGLTMGLSQQQALLPDQSLTRGAPFLALGYRLAMGSSYFNYDDEYYRGKSKFAFETGLYGQVKLTNALVLQPEVVYNYNGLRHVEGKINLHSLTTPLHLMLRTNNGSDFYPNFYVMAGGYYSWHLDGTVGGDKMDFDSIYNDHEYGLSLGAGFEIMKIQMGFTVRRSLSDIYKASSADNITKINTRLSLGYRF